MPGDVADPAVPSGGNTYDLRVCAGLGALGWRVHRIMVTGAWPDPDAAARDRLGRVLNFLPAGALVLLDGLVGCGVPEVVGPQADRLRIVVLVHMPLADDTGLAPSAAADLDARERDTLRAATAVVTTSPWSARRLADRYGLDRVRVAAPGTDPAPLAAGSAAGGRLLCVAAVTQHKAQDVLVSALATVTELAWRCDCVGSLHRDPGYVNRIRRLIDEHDLADRVRLVGPRTGAGLAGSYAEADLVVLPSHGETYGMVITEALARGIPVLATAARAVPDTLGRAPDGTVPGLLVPPANPAALAGAVRRWLTEPALRAELRAAARSRRDTLAGWPDTAKALAAALAEVVVPAGEESRRQS